MRTLHGAEGCRWMSAGELRRLAANAREEGSLCSHQQNRKPVRGQGREFRVVTKAPPVQIVWTGGICIHQRAG